MNFFFKKGLLPSPDHALLVNLAMKLCSVCDVITIAMATYIHSITNIVLRALCRKEKDRNKEPFLVLNARDFISVID